MSKSWKQGSSREWRKLRAQTLNENQQTNQGRCQLNVGRHCPRHNRPCPNICTTKAQHVHHVHGKANGDKNLIASCAACNLHVGNPTAGDPAPTLRRQW
jgi:hypothetical protein